MTAAETLNPRTKELLYRWLKRRCKVQRAPFWPETGAKIERHGLVWHVTTHPILERGTKPRESDWVDEMGWAFRSLSNQDQLMLMCLTLVSPAEWREPPWNQTKGISRKKSLKLWLRLQSMAQTRMIPL